MLYSWFQSVLLREIVIESYSKRKCRSCFVDICFVLSICSYLYILFPLFCSRTQGSRTVCYENGVCDGTCTPGDDGEAKCSCGKGKLLQNGFRCVEPPTNPECRNKNDTVFICTTGGKCVGKNFVCDGDQDCDDGSDESEKVCSKYIIQGKSDIVLVRKFCLSSHAYFKA